MELPDPVLRPMSGPRRRQCLSLLEAALSLPTAPFVEQQVLQFVRDFARQRKLHCQADRFGNLLVSRRAGLPAHCLIFVAHADHPGFVARRMEGPGRLLADWHGGVEPEYFPGASVRFASGEGPAVRGRIRDVEVDRSDGRQRVRRVLVEVRGEVAPATAGAWDLPAFRRKGRRVEALGCDDVAGVAAALAALDLLVERRVPFHAALLVTRAEEAGLIGASAAAFGAVLPRGARFVSIECSQAQPEAPLKAGPIVRLGDRASVFDPDLTDWLCRVAARIAETDDTFAWQRKLMPGGTCEASVFRSAGYPATGLCVPLGNYHNRDVKRRRVAVEYIDSEDWLGLVRLIAAAGVISPKEATAVPLAKPFQKWLGRYRPLLEDPLARPDDRGEGPIRRRRRS